MDANERYIAVENRIGAAYLCPFSAAKDAAEAEKAIRSDLCVEAEVAGRYAGQIRFERN